MIERWRNERDDADARELRIIEASRKFLALRRRLFGRIAVFGVLTFFLLVLGTSLILHSRWERAFAPYLVWFLLLLSAPFFLYTIWACWTISHASRCPFCGAPILPALYPVKGIRCPHCGKSVEEL